MKAAVYCGPGDVQIRQVAKPEPPGPGMVTLRIELAALCGTDASQFRRPNLIPLFNPDPNSGHVGPVIIGHEAVGVVEAVGEGVTGLVIGQRCVPGSGAWCGECPPCREGRTNICERYFLYGVQAHGGMAEWATYPARMCVPVPAECTPEAAVLAQPTAVAVHALDRAMIDEGLTVAFFGVGGIGSLMLAVLQAQYKERLTIFAVDIMQDALTTAASLKVTQVIDSSLTDSVKEIFAATAGRGCDVVIEATGQTAVIKRAIACVRRGGRLLQVGIPVWPANVLMDQLVRQEKQIIGTNGQICATDLAKALDLLTRTDLAGQIKTTVIDLDDLVEQGLLPLVEHRAHGKIVVCIGSTNSSKITKDDSLYDFKRDSSI